MRPRAFSLALFAAALGGAAALSGCMPQGPVSSSTAETTATVVVRGGSFSANPYSPQLSSRQVGELVFRGLTKSSASGDPVPDLLAELPTKANAGISADGLHITMRLKPNLRWQDGQPITSRDLAFTLGLLRDGELMDDPSLGYGDITNVIVLDRLAVRIDLAHSNSPLVWGMVPYLLPEHQLAKSPRPAMSDFWRAPVGSGPYRIVATVPGKEIALSPAEKTSLPLKVVIAKDDAEARKLYDRASVAAWIGGPAMPGGGDERASTAQSDSWRGWVFKSAPGSPSARRISPERLMSLVPETADRRVTADPFGRPLVARSAAETATVARELAAEGWRRGPDGTLERSGQTLVVRLARRTISRAESPRIDALTAKLASVGIVLHPVVRENMGVGGFLDRDYLTREPWDVADVPVEFGWPLGADWPFLSTDGPGLTNPYGLNVFAVRDSRLDAAYSKLLDSGDPVSARRAWAEVGTELDALKVVYWGQPQDNTVLYKGLSGVASSHRAQSMVESAPEWRLSRASAAGK